MCPQGIGHLRLAAAAIEVPERRTSRVEALAQPCLDTLEALFAEVSDVGGGDHGLDVGRQAAATRPEVDAVVREVHIDAACEQLAEVRPVSEVPGSAVDLVEDDAGGTTAGEATDHAAEYPTSRLRRCLHLFEPLADSEAVERGVPLDRSEEHTSELQSLMRISYAVFCLKKKQHTQQTK